MASGFTTMREAVDRLRHFVEQADGHIPEKRSIPTALAMNHLLSARAVVLRRAVEQKDLKGFRRSLYRDLTPIPLTSRDAVVSAKLNAPLSGIEFMVSEPIPRVLGGVLDGVTDLAGERSYEYIPFESISGLLRDRHPIQNLGYYTLRGIEPDAVSAGGGTARASIWILSQPGQPAPKAVRARGVFYDEVEVEEFLLGEGKVCNKLDLAFPVDGENYEEVMVVARDAIRTGKQLSPQGVDQEDDEQNGAHSPAYRPWQLR